MAIAANGAYKIQPQKASHLHQRLLEVQKHQQSPDEHSDPPTPKAHLDDFIPPPPVCKDNERVKRHPPVVVSLGSVGHPHKCGQACRYARRKVGCRDGAACLLCHQCCWSRQPQQEQEAEPPMSIGIGSLETNATYGVPSAQALKPCSISLSSKEPAYVNVQDSGHGYSYVFDKVGQDSTHHSAPPGLLAPPRLVFEPATVEPRGESERLATGTFFSRLQIDEDGNTPEERNCIVGGSVADLPSAGSLGHPHSCNKACKYQSKVKRGCKDGAACTRCHLCKWQRCLEK